jgi:glycosyltransferase involved in cell wall biosynthesis
MTTDPQVSHTPHVSIVIPVYNEQGILQGSVLELQQKLKAFGWTYEIVLCENGSRDRTVEIGKQLEAEIPQVRMISVGQPNYGLAMKTGILEARGTFVICDEIDLCDTVRRGFLNSPAAYVTVFHPLKAKAM